MRKVLLLGSIALVFGAGAATFTGPASAASASACAGFEYHPLFEQVTHVSARGLSCDAAREIAHRYLLATSSTSSSKGVRQGHCFRGHAYGACTVFYAKAAYRCFHNQPGHGVRGAVRCTRPHRVASFRLPF